jgi:outer membrane protein assembly factor BamB
VATGRLHTLGISGILSTVDKATGELLWRRTFDETHSATSPYYGTAMSPLVDGDRLIVHVGGHHDGALMALDAATGKTIWSLPGDGPSYASPIVVAYEARRQVVTQTDRHVVGVDAASGEVLWKVPFTTEWDQNTITPVFAGSHLIIAGFDVPTRAWKLVVDGPPTEIWSRPDLPLYMASPVIVGERLFGLSHKRSGQLFAIDVATGDSVWASPGRDGENVSMVFAADHLFVLNERAELAILDARADTFRTVVSYDVSETATWANPIVTRSGIVVKDATTLALLSFQAAAKGDEASP